MNPMDRTEYMPDEFARHIAERRASLKEADGFIRYAHSRSGLLARFLKRLVDSIDPMGEARRII